MKVEDKLLQKKEAVERELGFILSQEDSVLFQAMKQAILSGGKRFRPLLVLCSGELFGVPESLLLPYACAVELIHNYSLIHDDLPSMDNDDFRRGRPSCHKVFGEDIALLTGDSLLTLAFEVLAKASSPPGSYFQKEKAISAICQLAGVKGMIEGQLLDITLPPEKITEEVLHDLILKKTGSLIVASVKSGALLGQASPFQLEAMVEYGKNIGLAFQIRDDILDSVEKKQKNSLFRPNYVAFFGLEEAQRRLKGFVEAGIKALDEASLESEELRFLAFRLQD
jgi:geranylgeranyl diphosphate synthase type II